MDSTAAAASARAAAARPTSPSRPRTKPRGLDEETCLPTPNRAPSASPTSAAASPADAMDPRVWAALPDDLLLEILARVPPFLLSRLRAVSRRWGTVLRGGDPSFLAAHAAAPSHGPCLLAFTRGTPPHCGALSLPLRARYRLPLTFLPAWDLSLVGSSGGLVCLAGSDGAAFRTIVCNPLTQAWRALPAMRHNHPRQLVLAVDRKLRCYKLIAAASDDRTLPTEVYDSREDKWSVHQMMPAANLCSSKMAFCDSRLYLETLSPLGLMMYKVDAGHWEHIPAKFPRSLLDGYLVAGARRRLFLVGRIGLYSTLQSMRIWELDHGKTIWVEISRMPPKYFRALLRLSAERFECFGQDNLICFTSWNQGKGLLYDVDKKAWSWIAGCASQLCNTQFCFYEPRFDTSIF
ncbi:F-box/kelch-repeat protein At5g15710-like [Lolium rigidum]|uniref:F-box/kelch-repeat protein At5g15710-like n=1 Tax=Lolium rigidum TaxID=89674 RepID=UPI001F5E206A|nr:F-box/kelch-repeat protein At5g15710-like [Lolium rigidum]